MRKLVLAAAALACLAVPAQAMTVAEFLAKTKALRAKGLFAIGSPDIKPLKAEMKGITTAYRADLKADRDAGRTPHSCPPPEGKAMFKPDEFIAELDKVAAAQPNMSMKAAFYTIVKRKYPCR